MLADFNTELLLEPDELSCLQRMVARSRGSALTVRMRFDPLLPEVFDDVLDRSDMSRVLMFVELDEEAADILFVLRECEPPDGSPARRRRRVGAVTYPGVLTLAFDEETGGVVVEAALADAAPPLVHRHWTRS